jgi:hypothetical protein
MVKTFWHYISNHRSEMYIGLGDSASTLLKYKANGGHIAVTMHDKLCIGIADMLEEVPCTSRFV